MPESALNHSTSLHTPWSTLKDARGFGTITKLDSLRHS